MNLSAKKLIRLPVFTESGQRLGRIHDLEIDAETHQIKKYLVGNFLSAVKYLIAPAQVKSIRADRMIVEDGCFKETEKIKIRRAPAPEALNGLLSADEEAH